MKTHRVSHFGKWPVLWRCSLTGDVPLLDLGAPLWLTAQSSYGLWGSRKGIDAPLLEPSHLASFPFSKCKLKGEDWIAKALSSHNTQFLLYRLFYVGERGGSGFISNKFSSKHLFYWDMDEPVPSRAGPASSVNLIMQSLCVQLASEVDFKAVTHVCFEA
ncbi:Baculoviral Iap Repeat-Containing Protein 5 [Manis pentadactyla]|nr:Baculoviral Iap Repeat-Containing Protein 5 [Manis pentadactyla]